MKQMKIINLYIDEQAPCTMYTLERILYVLRISILLYMYNKRIKSTVFLSSVM